MRIRIFLIFETINSVIDSKDVVCKDATRRFFISQAIVISHHHLTSSNAKLIMHSNF